MRGIVIYLSSTLPSGSSGTPSRSLCLKIRHKLRLGTALHTGKDFAVSPKTFGFWCPTIAQRAKGTLYLIVFVHPTSRIALRGVPHRFRDLASLFAPLTTKLFDRRYLLPCSELYTIGLGYVRTFLPSPMK